MSRNELFKKSISNFFATFKVNENQESYSYNLKQETDSNIGNLHLFSIKIFKDSFELTSLELPTRQELYREIKNYFAPYVSETSFVCIKKFRTHRDIVLYEEEYETSQIEYGTHMIVKNIEETNIKMFLEVQYANKCNLPFPYNFSNEEQLRIAVLKNTKLESENNHIKHQYHQMEYTLNRKIRKLQKNMQNACYSYSKECKKLKEKIVNDQSRLTNKITEMYTNSDKKEVCPVCYEEIEPELLFVAGCSHFLCKSCGDRCQELNGKCPICRDFIYLNKEQNDEPIFPFPFPCENN